MLADWIRDLRAAGFDFTADEVADILWLAAYVDKPVPNAPEKAEGAAATRGDAAGSQDQGGGASRGAGAGTGSAPITSAATVVSQELTAGSTNLYPMQAAHPAAGGSVRARPFHTPAVHALPGALGLGRALRPLKRRMPSRTRFGLDETATADRIAESQIAGLGDWAPVTIPEPERWLDAVVVIDQSPGMVIWRQTVAEFVALLERLGAFRSIQTWAFEPDGADSLQLYASTASGIRRGQPRSPHELVDHLGRRLILVVSDCVSPLWYGGAVAGLLHIWGQKNQSIVMQVLPDRLWDRTALRRYPRLNLRTRQPGTPNALLQQTWARTAPRRALSGMPVPVMSLDAELLGTWAKSVAGNSNLWFPGVLCLAPESHASGDQVSVATPALTAEQRVQVFLGTASQVARRLAIYLSAVPLSLPIMRLVQTVMLPDSRQFHLAEVWLGGLIDRSPTQGNIAGSGLFDFFPGVRERLADNLRTDEAAHILNQVSRYVGERTGQALDFDALIADPDAEGTIELSSDNREFARVSAHALRRFGTTYEKLANRLEVSLGIRPGVTPSAVISAMPSESGDGSSQAIEPSGQETTRLTYALVVGVEHYRAISEAPGAVRDAEEIAGILSERFDVTPGRLRLLTTVADPTVETESLPTRTNILAAFDEIADAVEPGDSIYVFLTGLSVRVPTSDSNEPDGFDERFICLETAPNVTSYSAQEQVERVRQGDPDVTISAGELAQRLSTFDRAGVHSVVFIDTNYAGSGYFYRLAWRNTVFVLSCRENEQSYAFRSALDNQFRGAASEALADALRQCGLSSTRREFFDLVCASPSFRQSTTSRQTPQIVGAGDLTLGGSERRFVPPYLLVRAREIDKPGIWVDAHAALNLNPGARLAIYPPGSAMDAHPQGYALVSQIEATQVMAELESPLAVAPGSRARVLSYGDGAPLTITWTGVLPPPDSVPATLRIRGTAEDYPPDAADFSVMVDQRRFRITDPAGSVLWERQDGNPTGSAPERALETLLHIISYRHFVGLANTKVGGRLADAVSMRVESAAEELEPTIAAGTTANLVVNNRSASQGYFSIWWASARFGVQRLFPPQSDCALLAEGREVRVPFTVALPDPSSPGEEGVLKLFVTVEPHSLDVLQQNDLVRENQLTR